jgi:sulfate adenylyltransferase subunit 1
MTDILRIATAGSVDDGKSTLIGRLLYDTRNIPKDKMESIRQASNRKGLDFVDLSLLTDGLMAEREQGITIDVAHIYFSTASRKYIIADSPGHVEYTRNMITGASNCQVSVILVDARKGLVEQTRRHFYIASLLRMKHVAVCINKMDLVNFDAVRFEEICTGFRELAEKTGFNGQEVRFFPVGARDGDNIVFPSEKMSWYRNETLLEYLENVSIAKDNADAPARFPVQYVVRPHSETHPDFRGYAGRVESGSLRKGDRVRVLPAGRQSRIRQVFRDERETDVAAEKESVVITLDDDIDIRRGNMLVPADSPVEPLRSFEATVCWLDESPLNEAGQYILQHGVNRVKARVEEIVSKMDIHQLVPIEKPGVLHLNDIGELRILLAQPIAADRFIVNPPNGSFILVDTFSNNTVAVGFVR